MKCLLRTVAVLLSVVIVGAQPAQERPFSIRGRVIDHHGSSVANARIQASLPYMTSHDGRMPLATSDDQGRFVIGVPRVGRYTLTVADPRSRAPSTYNKFYFPHDKWRPAVVVESDAPAPEITLMLPPRHGVIQGTVNEIGTGKPITSASIRLCRLEEPNFCWVARIRDRTGRFAVASIDAPFSIEVTDAFGYEDWFTVVAGGVKAESTMEMAIKLETGSAGKSKAGRLPAPEIVFPKDGDDLFGFPRITKLQWSPVPDAVSYQVEIEGCQGNLPKEKGCTGSFPLQMPRFEPTAGIKGTSYEFEFLGNQPGRFRVWAVDAEGRPGKRTPWIVFYYPIAVSDPK